MRKYIVTENCTLGVFTDNTDAQASFAFRTLLKERGIRVNGGRTGADVALKAGDEVCYYMTPRQEQKPAFSVLYEDENIAVIDKESGVNTEAVLSSLCREGRYFAVHRIDRNTEGLLLFAKNGGTEEELLACFRERRVQKRYLALVAGRMPKRHAVEEAYLAKDPSRSFVTVSSRPVGEKIITEYTVLEERGELTLLEIVLHTGKTHQIRAHLAFLHHPVAGDNKYGDVALNKRLHLTRQRLIAKSIVLDCGEPIAYLNGRGFVSPKNF